MAVNDLMMKIQLLVESGKSSAELNRLQQALKALQNQLNQLDRTRLEPLSRDLEGVKRAAASLRTVNVQNFANSIDEVKKAFAGLRIGTANLDALKTAYQQLNTQLNAGNLQRYQAQLKTINQQLSDAKRLSLTATGQTQNANLNGLLTDLRTYNGLIGNLGTATRKYQQQILDLQKTLRSASQVKFDPSLLVQLEKLNPRRGLNNQPFKVIDPQSIASVKDYNNLLSKNQTEFQKAQAQVKSYQEALARLRVEAQGKAIPDLTLGGTRNLINELNQSQAKIRDLRTKELVPLQNQIREIQAKANFNKAFNIDPLKANVKVARAELAQLQLAAQQTRSLGGTVSVQDQNKIAQLKQKIVDDSK
jgi:hypothetical protein